jgi:hypothetical protein
MNLDTFLKIGHSHDICQDYILSGSNPCPYIILADGCSQAKDSDIGARILCHTALKYLKEHQSRLPDLYPDAMGERIIIDALKTQSRFYTKVDSLDATLIIAYKFGKYYHVYMYGDGVLCWKQPNGNVNIRRMIYKPNAPAYLRYQIDGFENYKNSNVAAFFETEKGEYLRGQSMDCFDIHIHEDEVQDLFIASDGVESFVFNREIQYKKLYNELRYVVMNDSPKGSITEMPKIIEQTLTPEENELNYKDVVSSMMNFKLTKGAFLSRRVKKVMKEYLKKGFINDDDLSIGCFHEDW